MKSHFLCTDVYLIKRKVKKERNELSVATSYEPQAEPLIKITKSEEVFILVKFISSGKTKKISTEHILGEVMVKLNKIKQSIKLTYPKNKEEAKKFLTGYVKNGNMTSFLNQFED